MRYLAEPWCIHNVFSIEYESISTSIDPFNDNGRLFQINFQFTSWKLYAETMKPFDRLSLNSNQQTAIQMIHSTLRIKWFDCSFVYNKNWADIEQPNHRHLDQLMKCHRIGSQANAHIHTFDPQSVIITIFWCVVVSNSVLIHTSAYKRYPCWCVAWAVSLGQPPVMVWVCDTRKSVVNVQRNLCERVAVCEYEIIFWWSIEISFLVLVHSIRFRRTVTETTTMSLSEWAERRKKNERSKPNIYYISLKIPFYIYELCFE